MKHKETMLSILTVKNYWDTQLSDYKFSLIKSE